MQRPLLSGLWTLLALGAAAALAACAGSGKPAARGPDHAALPDNSLESAATDLSGALSDPSPAPNLPPDTSLAALSDRGTASEPIDSGARTSDGHAREEGGTVAALSQAAIAAPNDAAESLQPMGSLGLEAAGGNQAAESPAEAAPAPAPDLTALRPQLVSELLDTFSAGDSTNQAEPDPLLQALRLIAASSFDPAAAEARLPPLLDALSPQQREAVTALHEVFAATTSSSADSGPDQVAIKIDGLADRITAARALNIPTAVLCQRVETFARYTPLAGSTFLAGRPIAAVLYVEVENFEQRAQTAADSGSGAPAGSVVSELGQELGLYNESGTLVWQRTEQVVRDTAQRRRRDYYLVNRLDLPGTLGVGEFKLKVTIRDKQGGGSSESILPLRIVADSSR
ncbi:MAG: hypothetical protein H7Y88_12690 [Phycisphaerales bacterium]|nr:hypothetical protein [Phycisphaerales bacterium]